MTSYLGTNSYMYVANVASAGDRGACSSSMTSMLDMPLMELCKKIFGQKSMYDEPIGQGLLRSAEGLIDNNRIHV